MADALGRFITGRLSNYDPERATHSERRAADYACHNFAYYLTGRAVSGFRAGLEKVEKDVETQKKQLHPLTHGAHGVLYEPNPIRPVHSYINLDDWHCLQVVEYSSNIGLTTYSELFGDFAASSYGQVIRNAIITPPPATGRGQL